jgi:hypothetical protein
MTDKFSLSAPRDFVCPITREIMRHPVLLIDDVSFDWNNQTSLVYFIFE